jgi:fido (protein-threonine AMPylation protein)
MRKKAKRTKNYKSYLILSERTNHLFGAFAYTEEGLKAAEKYVEKITKQYKETFIIHPI